MSTRFLLCCLVVIVPMTSSQQYDVINERDRFINAEDMGQLAVDDQQDRALDDFDIDVRALNQRKHKDCPQGFTYVSSVHGCYKIVLDNLEWLVAQLRCRSLHKDAHLLVVSDAYEQDAVAKLLATYSASTLSRCWRYPGWGVGFYTAGQRIDPARGSTFVWKVPPGHGLMGTDMLEMKYTHWEPSQPNHALSPCMLLFRDKKYQWADHGCTMSACSICEIDV